MQDQLAATFDSPRGDVDAARSHGWVHGSAAASAVLASTADAFRDIAGRHPGRAARALAADSCPNCTKRRHADCN